jgi:hypothetical protein
LTTPLDALVAALHEAASFNAAAEARPVAVVWCDSGSDFLPLIPALRERVPELLTYGEIDAATRTGPAVWLRAATSRSLGDVTLPDGTTPIIYLPGIARETLKGAEDCPPLLQPLVWYTVAGAYFGHVNGKDWTLRGFLSADRGPLKLELADDAGTRLALSHAAVRLCTRPVEELRGKRWNADQLNALLAPDLASDMLDWIDGALSEDVDPGRFFAFASIAKKELKFDPLKLSQQDAVKRLATREGQWASVWSRFSGSTGYAGVVEFLGFEEPASLFEHSENRDAYPKLNTKAEGELRKALKELSKLAFEDARARVLELEAKHAWRRDTVWARRGDAPLASALKHLAELAKAKSLPAHDGAALADFYTNEGAAADWEAMSSIACAPREQDRPAVTSGLQAIYLPWLEEGANALQELVRSGKVRFTSSSKEKQSATTLLFVDGLRMDVAQQLVNLLQAEGLVVNLGWTWSGFPTVTATCKPLVSPVASKLSGPSTTSDVLPITPNGKLATKLNLYKLMQAEGWETKNALLPEQKLWAETGRFDEEGHALGARLAERLASGVRDAADVVHQLIRAGRSIRIVTDHGWLLMPGNLPHAALDPGLVEPSGKRTRSAMVKPKAHTSYLQVPWSWNDEVHVAAATGARSFYAGYEYAHGGISPQECVLPIIEVAAGGGTRSDVSFARADWEGFRLRVEITGGADLNIDLRLGSETSGPSLIKSGRVLDEHGRTSFLVGDKHEHEAACLIVTDDTGRVIAQRATTIGGE